jgi:predicted dehydrogenase
MESLLRVGIIGLGQRWQRRYRPALAALGSRYQITAACDPVLERASQEARRLGCPAFTGPAELVQRKEVDAVLCLDPQWYRLWPVEVACQAGKPCLCCDSLERDEGHADRLCRLAEENRVLVLMGLPSRFQPAALALQELLNQRQAQVRLVLCTTAYAPEQPRPAAGFFPASLALLDWCTSLVEGAPVQILVSSLAGETLSTLLLRYADGQGVQICRYQVAGPQRPRRELQVITDRGTALVRLPQQVHWIDEHGRYAPRVSQGRPVEMVLLEQFHSAVVEGRPVMPDLAHVHRLLGWRRLALQSNLEGHWIDVAGEEHWNA